MRRLVLAVLALVLLRADMYPDASNAVLPQALNNLQANKSGWTYYSAAYGSCTWDDTHDTAPCIQAAIAAAATGGGGTVQLPVGTYGVSSTIDVQQRVTLEGAGASGFGVPNTKLLWLGAAGGVMLRMGSSTMTAPLANVGLEGFQLDGNGTASRGIEQWSVAYSRFRDVMVTNVTADGWFIDEAPDTTVGLLNQLNAYDNIIIYMCSAAAINANGLRVGPGRIKGDLARNYWLHPRINFSMGTGFIWGASDANYVFGGFVQPCTNPAGTGMEFSGSVNGQTSRGNMLYGTIVGGGGLGGIVSKAGAAGQSSAHDNILFGFKFEDGEPAPVCQAQGTALDAPTFYWTSVAGRQQWCGEPGRNARVDSQWYVVAKTANYTIPANTETGRQYTNFGTTGSVTFTLPAATGGGYWHCFTRATAFPVTLQAATGDFIRLNAGAASAAGGTVTTTSVSARLCLIEDSAQVWRALSQVGAWTTDAGVTTASDVVLNASGGIQASAQLPALVFGSLPTCNAGMQGAAYTVTNSNTAVFNAAVAGGGANVVIGFCNGTSWVVH